METKKLSGETPENGRGTVVLAKTTERAKTTESVTSVEGEKPCNYCIYYQNYQNYHFLLNRIELENRRK
jgi:hypothetical protein